jgi:hypothetical protein
LTLVLMLLILVSTWYLPFSAFEQVVVHKWPSESRYITLAIGNSWQMPLLGLDLSKIWLRIPEVVS